MADSFSGGRGRALRICLFSLFAPAKEHSHQQPLPAARLSPYSMGRRHRYASPAPLFGSSDSRLSAHRLFSPLT